MMKTALCDMLGIKYPIIQAAMGPLNTKKLATAVSNAGGMGTLSIYHMTAEPSYAYKVYSDNIKYITENSRNNFACNMPIGAQIGERAVKTTDAYLKAVVDARKDPKVAKRLRLLITSAGNPERYLEIINKERKNGMLHFHVVGSVRQAKKIESMGLDGVIASGFEMGGHTHRPPNVIHTFVLVPSVVDAVKIPVIASGGVCDAKTYVASLAMGAIGAQMATRFIATQECDFHDNYKQTVIDCKEYGDTLCPGAYSYLRVIKTEGALKAIEMELSGKYSHEQMVDIADEKMIIAEQDGDVVKGECPAGQCSSRVNDKPTVKEIIEKIMKESEKIIGNLVKLKSK